MIQIHNLTDRQYALLELLWDCKSLQELHDFQMMLDPDDLKLSMTLIELVKLEHLDQLLIQNPVLDQANHYIQKLSGNIF